MGLVPTPPTYKKPPPNWSLKRRYSFIVPRCGGLLRDAAENEHSEHETIGNSNKLNKVFTDTFRKTSPQKEPVSINNKHSAKEIEYPKLLNATQVCKNGFNETVDLLTNLPQSNSESTNFKSKQNIILLKDPSNLLNMMKSSSVSMVRVPTNYHPPESKMAAMQIRKSLENLPLLKLPTPSIQFPNVAEGGRFRLFSLENLFSILPTQPFYPNQEMLSDLKNMPSYSWNRSIREYSTPIRLLDIRKQYPSFRGSISSIPAASWTSSPKLIPLETCLSGNVIPKAENKRTGSTAPDIPLLYNEPITLNTYQNSNFDTEVKQSAQSDLDVKSDTSKSPKTEVLVHLTQNNENKHHMCDLGVQATVMEEKCTYVALSEDRGVQFDNILEDDAFIFHNYVIAKDGIHQISPRDGKYLREPLIRQDLAPAEEVSVFPNVLLNELLQINGENNDNQFLSVCSVDLSELNEDEPKGHDKENFKPMQMPTPHQEDLILLDNVQQRVRPSTMSDCGVQYEPKHDEIPCKENGDQRFLQNQLSKHISCQVSDSPQDNDSPPLGDRLQKEHCIEWLGEGSTRVRLDVVKALSEIDTKLMAVDRVSNRLEEEHRKNQELLERLIQMNSTQRASKGTNESEAKILKNQNLNRDEKNETPPEPRNRRSLMRFDKAQNNQTEQFLRTEHKSRDSSQKVDVREPADFGVSIKKPPCSDKRGQPRSRSLDYRSTKSTSKAVCSDGFKSSQIAIAANLARKRDQARIERKAALSAKRCEDTVKFVDKVLADCILSEIPSGPKKIPVNAGQVLLNKKPLVPQKQNKTNVKPIQRLRIAVKNSPFTRRPTAVTPEVISNNVPRKRILSSRQGANLNENAKISNLQTEKIPEAKCLQPDEDDQTTIISEWSIESDVRRILYGPDNRGSNKTLHQHETKFATDGKMSQDLSENAHLLSPRSILDVDQFTDGGAAASSSFIDWEEMDEILRDV